MKLKFLFLFLILGAVVNAVYAEECATIDSLLQEQLDVKYDFAFYRIENHRIGMESLITYLDDSGKDVSTLGSIKKEFVSKGAELEKKETLAEFDSAVNGLKTSVLEFRDEAKDKIKNLDEAEDVVSNALEEKQEYLQALLDSAYEHEVQHQFNRFDASVCRLQNFIDVFKKIGHDMSDAQLKLDNYNSYRSDIEDSLNDASDSCKDVALLRCETSEREDFADLRQEVKDEFIKTRTFVGIKIAQTSVDKTKQLIDRFEKIGIDTSDIASDNDALQDRVDSATNYYLDTDYNSASNQLSGFAGDVRGIRQDLRKAVVDVREGLRGDAE